MPETFSPEDEAALYALDGLTPTERRKFEARLAESAELRTMVREFEEGAVALTLAAPMKSLPKGTWENIHGRVGKEAGAKSIISSIWTRWWRQGWAAAAACLAGWLIYALWTSRSSTADAQQGAGQLAQSGDGKQPADGKSAAANFAGSTHRGFDAATNVDAALQLRGKEITLLRREVTELESRITNLSDELAQQQSMLGESNRMRLFELTPANAASGGTNGTPSPEMQRALFLAMARQMGWGPQNGSGGTNQGGAQFIDLRPNANTKTGATSITPTTQDLATTTPTPTPVMPDPGTTIPAFQSESNVFLAIDSSVAPEGSHVTVSTGDGQSSGDLFSDGSPVIIAVPAGMDGNGIYLTISGLSPDTSGWTNWFQYFTTVTNHP